jgi:RecA-family ATPase
MSHIEDDDLHEAGGEIPSEGTPVDPEDVRRAREAREAGKPAEDDPLDGIWKTLGEWGPDWLTAPPPARRWLLERPDDETNGTTKPVGVLPLGKAAMLLAAGGVGKTMILVQLALAVATGRKFLDHFGTPNPGHVLIVCAEEDAEELRRRLYNAAQAMKLTDEQASLAAKRIVIVPLSGISAALLENDGRNNAAETAMLRSIRRRLNSAPHEWRLVILDPLSRFAGCDTEKDNAAATQFVTVVESFTKTKGGPTVLLAHHTNKASRSAELKASASDSRGASALTDGVRWVANLYPELNNHDLATLVTSKSNYSKLSPELTLVRDNDHGGALRAETPAESAERSKKAKETKAAEKHEKASKGPRDQVPS